MDPDTDLTCVATDGIALPGYAWLPREMRGVLAIVHGMGEHAGRYARFAERAKAQGIGVVAADLRGHGRAPGERCYVEHFDDYALDARAILSAARERAAGRPLFVMGHSMGGAVLLRLLERMPEWRAVLSGVVFSSAALKIGPGVSPILLKLLPVVARVAPRLRVQRLDPALISRIPEEVERYASDPLVAHRPPPLRTALGLIQAMATFTETARSQQLPMLAFHGEADGLTAVAGSRTLYANWGGSDKTLRLWPGAYHETLNDREGEAVANDLLAWLEHRLPR